MGWGLGHAMLSSLFAETFTGSPQSIYFSMKEGRENMSYSYISF